MLNKEVYFKNSFALYLSQKLHKGRTLLYDSTTQTFISPQVFVADAMEITFLIILPAVFAKKLKIPPLRECWTDIGAVQIHSLLYVEDWIEVYSTNFESLKIFQMWWYSVKTNWSIWVCKCVKLGWFRSVYRLVGSYYRTSSQKVWPWKKWIK